MTEDLVRWLGEQLDEDERIALAAREGAEGRWHHHGDENGAHVSGDHDGYHVAYDEGYPTVEQAAFIAEHDPARVLREIEAKRRVLRQHEDVRAQVRNPVSAENRRAARVEQGALEDVMRLLAMPYADRPGYREEWRP